MLLCNILPVQTQSLIKPKDKEDAVPRWLSYLPSPGLGFLLSVGMVVTLSCTTPRPGPLPQPTITSLSPAQLSILQGGTGILTATISAAPATTATITLSSSAPSIVAVPPIIIVRAGQRTASITVNGLTVGGPVTISASLGGATASATVNVTSTQVVALAISPVSPRLIVGESQSLTATGTMSDGTTRNLTDQVTWTSSDPTIATISNHGIATAIKEGTATVTASITNPDGSSPITASTTLTVVSASPLSWVLRTTSLKVGETVALSIQSGDPAGPNGLLINLSQSGVGSVSMPSTVMIQAGQTTVPVNVTGAAAGSVVLTANAVGHSSGTATLTVTPVALSITDLCPTSAVAGTLLTITGTGFDPVAANNHIAFGVGASVSALTATAAQLTVVVPTAAQTGAIAVTTPSGTATGPIFTVLREQDFNVVANPAAVTVVQGASTVVMVQLSSLGTKPFTALVTMSASGLPAGAAVAFSPLTVSASQTGKMTVNAAVTVPPGTYDVTIKGEAAPEGVALSKLSTVKVTVLASTGTTGVKGRFVDPTGQGVAGVKVILNEMTQATTDAAGNFLLTGLSPGELSLKFDATAANPLYPIWPSLVQLEAGKVTVMPDWVVNPPPTDDKFTPINNSAQAQKITDDRFPGLEVTLPAGTTITGWDGVPKTRIAVERIAGDKLSVPPPPVPIKEAYQLFFGTAMGGIPSAPIPVTLPNVTGLEPGDTTEIWYYDGSPMGGTGQWKLAGLGTVSTDGKSVVSNPGVGIPRFCGVCGLVSLRCPPPPTPPQPSPEPCKDGNPVELYTGQALPNMGGMRCGGLVPVEMGMSYNPVDAFNNRAGTVGSVGFGWVLDYDIVFLPFSGPQKRIVLPAGQFVNFTDQGGGIYRNNDDPRFDGAVLRATNLGANEWELRHKEGRIWRFKPFPGITGIIRGGPPLFLTEIIEPAGATLTITRQNNGRLLSVGTLLRTIQAIYSNNGFIAELRDPADRTTRYSYNANNRLESITDPEGKVTRYSYVGDDEIVPAPVCGTQPTGGERVKTVTYPGRPNPTENFYGSGRRVLRQVGYDGREFRFSYQLSGACVTNASNPAVLATGSNVPTVDSWENYQSGWRIHGGQVTATTVTRPDGTQYTVKFNSKGMFLETQDALGQTAQVKRDANNRAISRTDALGNVSLSKYDSNGNQLHSVDPLGRITDMTYDPKWNKLTSITRYLKDGTPVVTLMVYDPDTGLLKSVTDPLGHVTTFAYTDQGQVKSITDALSHVRRFEYNPAGDALASTDALGNKMSQIPDDLGRLMRVTDAQGAVTETQYNGVDQVTHTIDANAGVTELTYDAAQRLKSVTNQRNKTIESYDYDPGDRLFKRTDALSKSETMTYDKAGRVETITDRKGKVTKFAYDAEGRVLTIERTDFLQTRSYDALGRLIRVAEGAMAIGYGYDAVGRLVTETQDTGAGFTRLNYEYDTLDRRVKRTVNGSDETIYVYDNASRLKEIRYRGQVTIYTWDDANRLKQKTLPNGNRQELTWDDADRLKQILYRKTDGTILDTINYTYDANGNRLGKDIATESLLETPITATYDDANRMASLTFTASGETCTLGYDDNGNLARKACPTTGTTVYTWDSRNRLSGVTVQDPATPATVLLSATFKYDPLDRRVERTINGNTTQYIYDGPQAIAEVNRGSVRNNLLTGLAIDEVLGRYAANGNRVYLTDALGSVIAQAKDDQTIQNTYAYSPYGEAKTSGNDEDNSVQYTARENDGTGLMYFRARYYDPVLKRFISEDPIGLGGSMNSYTYANNNPIYYADPNGQFAIAVPLIILIGEAIADALATTTIIAGGIYCIGTQCLGPLHWPSKDLVPPNTAPRETDAKTACPSNNPRDPCKEFRRLLREHEQKLLDYISDPTQGDNRKLLGKGWDVHVIWGRIKELQKQIGQWKKIIEECERKHGMRD